MKSKIFGDIHLRRKDKVTSLKAITRSGDQQDEVLNINHNQLFHRITCIMKNEDDLEKFLTFELTTQPPALFDNCSMRKGTKSSLITVLNKMVDSESSLPVNAMFTVNGGYLLHKLPWTCPATFGNICDQYVQYVLQKYGQNCTMVFDGYKSSTKDEEHFKRCVRTVGTTTVEFGEITPVVSMKE